MKSIKTIIILVMIIAILTSCVRDMTDEEILQRAKELEASMTADATEVIETDSPASTPVPTQNTTQVTDELNETDEQSLDDSYYSEVYPLIKEMFFDNLFNVYLEPISEYIISFEYYNDAQDGIALRVYIDISATEAVFMLGDSDMDIQVSETGYEEIAVEYPDTDGTVVFKEDSLFFENFDLSYINAKEIIDIFPSELFPEITKEQGESGIDIILADDGSINILQQNVYSGNQQHLIEAFEEVITENYTTDSHMWDGYEVYEIRLPRGGKYRAEINNYMIRSVIEISHNKSSNVVTDQSNISEFMVTETSEILYELLNGNIYIIHIMIQDSGEMMFVDNQNGFYKVEKNESLRYMYELDKNIDMSELIDAISKAFPDYNTRVEANGEMQFWSYEEKEVFGLFKNTDNPNMSACIMLNIFDIPQNNPIDKINIEQKYHDFLAVPQDIISVNNSSKDIDIMIEKDEYASIQYFNGFTVNDMALETVVSIMEEHFIDTMGEFEKDFDGGSIILNSVNDIGCVEIGYNNGNIRVYVSLDN